MKKPRIDLHLKVFSGKSDNPINLNPYKFKSLVNIIPDDTRIYNQIMDCKIKNIPLQPVIVNMTQEDWELFEKEVKSKISNIKGFPAELYYMNTPLVFLNKPE